MNKRKLDIRMAREKAGITQEKLARLLDVAQSTVACWETERSVPSADRLPDIAKCCKCKIESLFVVDSSTN